MDRATLHAAICGDLNNRKTWENRQRIWYEMRHDGLRRRNKPWDGASDMHFPLSDTLISKLKPYYFEQLYATELLASFVPRRAQDAQRTNSAARWFDYKAKQQTNLETEILTVIDTMLMSGRSVVKVFWNAKNRKVEFDAVSALDLIVPEWTEDLESADRITHVMSMSVAAYKRNTNYAQGDDIIKKIAGTGSKDNDSGGAEDEKEIREGITGTRNEEMIILWEVYTREGNNWVVTTMSPLCPREEIRAPFALAYNHGLPPFVDFTYEVKDKGWYSPRGIVEQVASFENSLCKLWNEKHDCMTLYNRPLFRTPKEVPNPGNLKFKPGQILPFDIQPVQHGQPPMSFDQEMVATRMVAEQRVAMPDFGIGQVTNTTQRRTATEVNAVGELMGNATDLRMRIFRLSLGRLYRQVWSLLVQYDSNSLEYFFEGEPFMVDRGALQADYELQPTGSADGVNRQYLFQKAVTRFQMFNQDPYIKQEDLRRSILEADDSTLVKRLMTNPQQVQASQAEDQAQEISILKMGFPAAVNPADDHGVHVQTLVQYLMKQVQTKAQFDPIEGQRIMEHIQAHIEMMGQTNPKGAKELTKMVEGFMAQGQQQAPAPGPEMA